MKRSRQGSGWPWIISFSVFLYRCVLTIGPADFRREYEELAIEDFRQYCKDIYTHQGVGGVLSSWPTLFSEALADMLVERLSTFTSPPESYPCMFYNIRRSMTTVFYAFVLFATAYVCLQYIAGSVTHSSAHNEIKLIFTVIKYSTNAAFLSIALCGLPMLFFILKRVLKNEYDHHLSLVTAGQILAFLPTILRVIVSRLGYAIVASVPQIDSVGFLQFPLESVLSLVFLTDILFLIIIVLLIGKASPVFIVPRRDFSITLLHFARVPMIIATFAMGIALVASILWAAGLWIITPDLTAHTTGSGIFLLLIFSAMTLSCITAASALRGCMNSHTLAIDS